MVLALLPERFPWGKGFGFLVAGMAVLTRFTIMMTGVSSGRARGNVDKDDFSAKLLALSASDFPGDE